MDSSLALVLTRARQGEGEAHEELFRRYEKLVYTVARRILPSTEEAEEVLQETFLELFRSLRKLENTESFAPWIRRITSRKALDHLRRSHVRKASSLESSHVEKCSGVGSGPQEHIDLERALAQLKAIDRAVIWLHDVEGFTHDEIAEGFGKTRSFSKSRLARARKSLREYLERRPDDDHASV